MSGALQSKRVGFIGCGAMASALAGGLVRMGITPERMQAADPLPEQRKSFEANLGIRTGPNNSELVAQSDPALAQHWIYGGRWVAVYYSSTKAGLRLLM